MGKKNSAQEFRHKHSLGQNFLTDEALLAQLVDAANVGENDAILEIGPGAGGMTKELAKHCKSVLALEIDETLLPILRVALADYSNVTVIHGDVMRVRLPELTKELGAFHIVANLPYYLTTPLMEKLLKSDLPILSMSVMLQLEAAEKLCSAPREDGYGPLAIRTQWLYEPEIAMTVPACMFTPTPKVDSAFLTMHRREVSPFAVKDEKLLFKLVNAAFAMRRKTLVNNLMSAFLMEREQALSLLASVGLSASARGEELSLQDYAALANALSEQ